MFRRALREAAFILLASTLFGFGITAIYSKGFFAKEKPAVTKLRRLATLAPRMISATEAKAQFDGGQAIFIDARHEFDYKRGHIKGAVNVPLNSFNAEHIIATIPRDRVVIAYCDGIECNSSIELAGRLYDAGYSNVKIFFSGWQDWTSNKYPTEGSPK